MRVHATDQLFGLEAFSRSIQTEPAAVDAEPADASNPMNPGAPSCGLHRGFSTEIPAAAVDDEARMVRSMEPETSLAIPATASNQGFASLLSRKVVLSLVFILLVSTVGLSLFTLMMKTRKKAASYELAHQTRVFRRMSKHRAIYDLEYAFLRSNSPILEEFSRQGWREITPHDLTYIPVKKAGPRPQRGLAW